MRILPCVAFALLCAHSASALNGPRAPSVPLVFESAESGAAFLARRPGLSLRFTSRSLDAWFARSDRRLRMEIAGANGEVHGEGLEATGGHTSYFRGADPSKWRSSLHYSRVRFTSARPGIDLVYHANGSHAEFDFVAAPGSDPSAIRLRFVGSDRLTVDRSGTLVVAAGSERLRFHRPLAHQIVSGRTARPPVRWRLEGKIARMEIGAYDPALPLVLDPTITYATFLGGSGSDAAYAVAADAKGAAYVAGETISPDFPGTLPSADSPQLRPVYMLASDAFVTKLSADRKRIEYSVLLGGTGADRAFAVGVDSQGNIMLGGATNAYDFPVTQGAAFPVGYNLAFVARLSADGSTLLASTLVPLTAQDVGSKAFGFDSTGNFYAVGRPASGFTATAGAFQEVYATQAALRISPDCTKVVYATYLPGLVGVTAMAVQPDGRMVFTGTASSASFPVTRSCGWNCPAVAYVVAVNSAGTALVYSQVIGHSNSATNPVRVALGPDGSAVVTGWTADADFPQTGPTPNQAFKSAGSFAAKVSADGTQWIFSMLTGSTDSSNSRSLAVSAKGEIAAVDSSAIRWFSADGALIDSSVLSLALPGATAFTPSGTLLLAGASGDLQTTADAVQPTLSSLGLTDAAFLEISPDNPVPVLYAAVTSPTRLKVADRDPQSPTLLRLRGANFIGNAAVYCGGKSRSFALVSSELLDVTLEAADLRSAGPLLFQVINQTPGGGRSNELSVDVLNVRPNTVTFGAAAASVDMGGSTAIVTIWSPEINETTLVEWNGEFRPANLNSDNHLELTLNAADLAAARVCVLRLYNPPPGGGFSGQVYFRILNTTNTSANLIPVVKTGSAIPFHTYGLYVAGGFNFNATFTSQSAFLWDGAPPFSATVVDQTDIQFIVTEAQTSRPGLIPVTVRNTNATSNVAFWSVLLPKFDTSSASATQRWAYNPADGLLYGINSASRLVSISPQTGAVSDVGELPAGAYELAITDGGFLYAFGSTTWLIDLSNRTKLREFKPLMPSFIITLPGVDHSIVDISLFGQEQAAVYDDGVRRLYSVPLPDDTAISERFGSDNQQVILSAAATTGCVWMARVDATGMLPFEQHCIGAPGNTVLSQIGGILYAGPAANPHVVRFDQAEGHSFSAVLDLDERRLYAVVERTTGTYTFETWDIDSQKITSVFQAPLPGLKKLIRTGAKDFIVDHGAGAIPITLPDPKVLAQRPGD